MNSLNYYAAILAFAPDCWKESNRLFQYNKDRDNSFKRYMREHTKKGQTYGSAIKSLIDHWMTEYSDNNVEQFLNEMIANSKDTAEPWLMCILTYPSILEEAWNKRLYEVNGHVIFAQRKTPDSHCFDPVLLYLREVCKANGMKEQTYKLHDSKSDYFHAFELTYTNQKFLIHWSADGKYSLQINDDIKEYKLSDNEVITYMEAIIMNHKVAVT